MNCLKFLQFHFKWYYWLLLQNLKLQLTPKIFYRIKVWTLPKSLHDLIRLLLRVLLQIINKLIPGSIGFMSGKREAQSCILIPLSSWYCLHTYSCHLRPGIVVHQEEPRTHCTSVESDNCTKDFIPVPPSILIRHVWLYVVRVYIS